MNTKYFLSLLSASIIYRSLDLDGWLDLELILADKLGTSRTLAEFVESFSA